MVNVSGLPPFYQGVFKSWALFNPKKCLGTNSLHWLLKEPLIGGAKLDVADESTPGLTTALVRTRTVTLQALVDAVGLEMDDAHALGSLLGIHSIRMAERLLGLWASRLTVEEKGLLRGRQSGFHPDQTD